MNSHDAGNAYTLRVSLVLLTVLALICVPVLASCTSNSSSGSSDSFAFVSPGGQTDISYPQDERKPIGTLSGPDLMDPNKTLSVNDFPDQVVVLNAWGQWCGPCRAEADDLQAVQEKLNPEDGASQGTVLGINVRDPTIAKAQDFVKDNGITYPSLYDPPFKSASALGGFPASVIPTTIILDRQHRPARIFLRGITEDELWDAVQDVLDER